MKEKERRVPVALVFALLAIAMLLCLLPKAVFAEEDEIVNQNNIPAYLKKDVLATGTIRKQINIVTESNNISTPVNQNVSFKLINTTLQKSVGEVVAKNGKLTLDVINGHNYTLICNDPNFMMRNVYFWVTGGTLKNLKETKETASKFEQWVGQNGTFHYIDVDSITLSPRDDEVYNPRVQVDIPVKYNGTTVSGVKFRLIADDEELTCTSNKAGHFIANLLEDKDYMVTVEDDRYSIAPFPMAVKDKYEYRQEKYAYNHSNCHKVESLELVNKGNEHTGDTTKTSRNTGNTTVTGMNFSDMYIFDRILDRDISALSGKDYQVVDIYGINPHRWEYTRLHGIPFTYTEKVKEGETVENLYYLDDDELKPLDFTQDGNAITFSMDTLSEYPIVIQYEKEEVDVHKLKVKVVDQNNKPIEGVELLLKSTNYAGYCDQKLDPTNKDGEVVFNCEGNEDLMSDDVFYLQPVDNILYKATPIKVRFTEDNNTSVNEINEKPYDGSTVILKVQSGEEPTEKYHRMMIIRVLDQNGKPVENVDLKLYNEDYKSEDAQVPLGMTNDKGEVIFDCSNNNKIFDDCSYYIQAIDTEKYGDSSVYVHFELDGFNPYIDSVDDNPYDGGTVTLRVQTKNEEPVVKHRTMKIQVLDQNDKPVENFNLTMHYTPYDKKETELSFGLTNKDGIAVFDCANYSEIAYEEGENDLYQLFPDNNDSLKATPIDILFQKDEKGYYFESVDGKPYNGDTITLRVTTKEDPEPPIVEKNHTTMQIEVVDTDGNHITDPDFYLQLMADFGTDQSFDSISEDGLYSFDVSAWGESIPGDEFTFQPKDSTKYDVVEPLSFTLGLNDSNKLYIETVNGQKYNGNPVRVTVEKKSTTPDPDPEPKEYPTILHINVVDENGKPFNKAKLGLSSFDNPNKIIYLGPTDEKGNVTYAANPEKLNVNTTYTLVAMYPDKYELIGDAVKLKLGRDLDTSTLFFAKVNGQEYIGDPLTIKMKRKNENPEPKPDNKPEPTTPTTPVVPIAPETVSEMTSDQASIKQSNGNVTFTIKGSDLPDTAYYQLYVKTRDNQYIPYGNPTLTNLFGETASLKTFDLHLPKVDGYTGWKIGFRTEPTKANLAEFELPIVKADNTAKDKSKSDSKSKKKSKSKSKAKAKSKAKTTKTKKTVKKSTKKSVKKSAKKTVKKSAKVKSIKFLTSISGKRITLRPVIKTTGKNTKKTLTWTFSNLDNVTIGKSYVRGTVISKKKYVKVTAKATDGSGKRATFLAKVM